MQFKCKCDASEEIQLNPHRRLVTQRSKNIHYQWLTSAESEE